MFFDFGTCLLFLHSHHRPPQVCLITRSCHPVFNEIMAVLAKTADPLYEFALSSVILSVIVLVLAVNVTPHGVSPWAAGVARAG